MVNKSYAKGRTFEYKVMKLLSECGFDVTRSAGSKGIKDIVAVKHGRVYYIQCKYNAGDINRFIYLNSNEIKRLYTEHKVIFMLACRPKPRKHTIEFIVVNKDLDENVRLNILSDFSKLVVVFKEVV